VQVPETPTIAPLDHISPSIYEASLKCLAKATWYAQGDRRTLPDHPAAILGICFHTVVAASHYLNMTGERSAVREAARSLFDRKAATLYENVHPLSKAKFSSPERLPYYNLYRERAALYASQVVDNRPPRLESAPRTTGPALRRTEARFESADGLIVGRPDYIDTDAQTIVDYKSGVSAIDQADAVSEAETRQLRVYAYLAFENGIAVSKGVIVRGDGRRCQIEITKNEADGEASSAKAQLQAINGALADGQSFDRLASASVQNCQMCPCLPFCETFWRESKAEWVEQCGMHVEGIVREVSSIIAQGVALVTLRIEPQRGTLNCASAFIEQIPEEWLIIDGTAIPTVGDVVRVVHARRSDAELAVASLRVDKALTSLWSVLRSEETPAESDG